MMHPSIYRRALGVGAFTSIVAASFVACSSAGEGTASPGGGHGGSGNGGSGNGGSSGGAGFKTEGGLLDTGSASDAALSADAYWANDPPPASCDGGPAPPAPGGTVDCPNDKNREGCPCPKIGDTAACWPGYRKNRDLGQCKDGTTTCIAKGENGAVWGACENYVLPDPNATAGKAACLCFSQGQWKLDNLSPCFITQSTPGDTGAISTYLQGSQYDCPPSVSLPLTAPTSPFSPNTLTVDCAGHFRLCYTLKAGDAKNPQPTDCTLIQVCTEADYTTPNVAQPFPDLPSWKADSAAQIACSQQFNATGGYGEMSVQGLSVQCDAVPDHVFNRVEYCKSCCNDNSCPSDPTCASCSNGGGGVFN